MVTLDSLKSLKTDLYSFPVLRTTILNLPYATLYVNLYILGRPLLVQIELLNVSPVSIHFGLCQVFIETGIQGSRKEIILTDWLSDDCDVGINQQAIPIHLTPNSSKSLYFVITPTLEHANISCSFDNYVIVSLHFVYPRELEAILDSKVCFVD